MSLEIRLLRSAIVLAIACGSVPVRADITKSQCVDANGKGQDLRRDEKLSEARDQFSHCANPSCPAIVRDDCTKRLDELERAQPTVIFDAKDGTDRDLSAVKVTMDGSLLTEKLDGTALRVDPGAHVFSFSAAEQAPVTQTFVIKEGDKERRERIVIGPPATVVATTASAPPPPSPASSVEGGGGSVGAIGTQRIVGLTSAGVGVVGIALGAVYGAMTLSKKSQYQSDCPNAQCSDSQYAQAASDRSMAKTDLTISTVGFIAGGVLLAGGAILFFTAAHSSEPTAAAGVVVVPSVGPGSGGMLLRGAF